LSESPFEQDVTSKPGAFQLKYKGHAAAKGYAPICPNCGFWLEHTDNCGAPDWKYDGHVLAGSGIVGLAVGLPFGLTPGLAVGAVCYGGLNLAFSPAQPAWYCHSCKSYHHQHELHPDGAET